MTKIKKRDPQKRVLNLIKEYEALLIFSNQLPPGISEELRQLADSIPGLSSAKTRKTSEILRTRIETLRKGLGAKVSGLRMIELLDSAGPFREADLYCPKYIIESLFSNYPMPHFYKWPQHAHISLRPLGRQEATAVEVVLLEAILFENMAALFNLALDYQCEVQETRQKLEGNRSRAKEYKRVIKTSRALQFGVVFNAVTFFEAYLNGLAADYYWSNLGKLDKEAESILKDRPRYLTLREKALKYQQIVGGYEHPPLQESNCGELKFILTRAKDLRDALAHPSAIPQEDLRLPKEHLLFSLDFDEVSRLVDQVIALVRKLEQTIHGDEKRLHWLHERGNDGRFADDAFD